MDWLCQVQSPCIRHVSNCATWDPSYERPITERLDLRAWVDDASWLNCKENLGVYNRSDCLDLDVGFSLGRRSLWASTEVSPASQESYERLVITCNYYDKLKQKVISCDTSYFRCKVSLVPRPERIAAHELAAAACLKLVVALRARVGLGSWVGSADHALMGPYAPKYGAQPGGAGDERLLKCKLRDLRWKWTPTSPVFWVDRSVQHLHAQTSENLGPKDQRMRMSHLREVFSAHEVFTWQIWEGIVEEGMITLGVDMCDATQEPTQLNKTRSYHNGKYCKCVFKVPKNHHRKK